MSATTSHIAALLRSARETKGLSQRALSELAGVPQGHISKIENGAVDLRVSSLVQLARVLDMELTLVPRQSVPAVNSIVRTSKAEELASHASSSSRSAVNMLRRMQERVAEIMHLYPTKTELAQLQRQIRDLQQLSVPERYLKTLREANSALRGVKRSGSARTIAGVLERVKGLRTELAHGAGSAASVAEVRPAYTLDDEHDE